MSIIELAELLQQDIKDLKGIFNYKNCQLTREQIKMLVREVMLNLEYHVEELIKESIK